MEEAQQDKRSALFSLCRGAGELQYHIVKFVFILIFSETWLLLTLLGGSDSQTKLKLTQTVASQSAATFTKSYTLFSNSYLRKY